MELFQIDRDNRGDEGWRYDRPQARGDVHRTDDRHDGYREARHDRGYDRNARVDVFDCNRGVSIDIGGFFAQR